jgi:hypothetical protein
MNDVLAGFILISLALMFYFLPTIIASRRGLRNVGSIFVLNFFLGWMGIGWVVALVWAVSGTAERGRA